MRQVKVSPAGIRGLVDQGLDVERVIDLVSAFATWVGGAPVLVARDTRPSSPMLAAATISALSAGGCEVLDAGMCPTAVAQATAARLGAGGAISVTASHSDAAWNGLKLFGDQGRVLDVAEGREILDLWHQGEYVKAHHQQLGAIRKLDDVSEIYLGTLLDSFDVDAIAAAGLRVVVDAGNGAGAMLIPTLCHQLGLDLIPVGCEPSGDFVRLPDPTERSMGQAAAIVAPVGAQVGFGFSSDCERLSMITDQGLALGTGATLPLIVDGEPAIEEEQQTVVASIASDSRVDQVAQRRGYRVVRCGVGVQAVISQMLVEEAVVGGEGSGGVALARLRLSFDGLAAMVRLLERVATAGSSQPLADALPVVHARSAIVACPVSRAYSAVARLRAQDAGRAIDLDGVRVDLDGGWFHLRVSNTEPVIRITCEAPNAEEADQMIQILQRRVQAAIYA